MRRRREKNNFKKYLFICLGFSIVILSIYIPPIKQNLIEKNIEISKNV